MSAVCAVRDVAEGPCSPAEAQLRNLGVDIVRDVEPSDLRASLPGEGARVHMRHFYRAGACLGAAGGPQRCAARRTSKHARCHVRVPADSMLLPYDLIIYDGCGSDRGGPTLNLAELDTRVLLWRFLRRWAARLTPLLGAMPVRAVGS